MKIILFLTINLCAAFGIFQFFNTKKIDYPKPKNWINILIVMLLAAGLIGNFFLCRYILS